MLAAALFLFALPANAQDVPIANLFVGGSAAANFDSNHDDAIGSGVGPEVEINFNLSKSLGAFAGFTFRPGRDLDENMVGIRYFIETTDSFRYYVHGMAGGASGKGGGFVFGGGSGLDLLLADWIGFRLFKFDIISTVETGYFRVAAGLVFDLGKR